MPHLHFHRSLTEIEADEYFDSKTDVWVFGDVEGYCVWIKSIQKALDSRRPVALPEISLRSNSMLAVLMPVSHKPSRVPRLKIIERLVFLRKNPRMEVVFHANVKGYQRLVSMIDDLIDQSSGCPRDHFHLDDWIVKRSVGVNVRGPLRKWSRKNLVEYGSTVFTRGPRDLPGGVAYIQPYEYTLPSVEDNPFLSLEH
jgi:hypothetical protein